MATATKRALSETRKIVREEFRPVYGDRQELGRYALDPLAHLDEGHVRVLDLGTNEETVFRPWPNQREIAETWVDLDHLRETGRPRWRNVHEEKSRQEGVTWILAYLDWWALNYHTASGLVLHLKFKKVDDGGSVSTPESYFGKIRYIHSRMPDEHRAPLHFKLGQISNLYDARSFLVAEGEDSEAGRGGHYDRGVLDEAARLTWGASVHMAISRAIPHGRFYNSTPFGEDNEYARLRKARPRSFVFLTHHWTTHPVYADGLHVAAELDADTRLIVNEGDPSCDQCEATLSGEKWTAMDPVAHRYPGRPTSPWYEEAILELTDTQVAQELDIDYAGSLAARVYPMFSELAHVDAQGFGYDPSLPVSFCIDYGIDATPVVFLQEAADEVRAIGEVGIVENATPDVVNGLMRQELRRIGLAEKELAPVFTLEMQGVGDPAGEARQAGTGRSLVAEYRWLGWSIVSQPRPIATTITALTRLLNGRPKPFVISGPDCPELIDALKHNRWPTDRQGVRKASAREPLNDRFNHVCRALSYLAAYRFPPPEPEDSIGAATLEAVRRSDHSGRLDSGVGYGMRF